MSQPAIRSMFAFWIGGACSQAPTPTALIRLRDEACEGVGSIGGEAAWRPDMVGALTQSSTLGSEAWSS